MLRQITEQRAAKVWKYNRVSPYISERKTVRKPYKYMEISMKALQGKK